MIQIRSLPVQTRWHVDSDKKPAQVKPDGMSIQIRSLPKSNQAGFFFVDGVLVASAHR